MFGNAAAAAFLKILNFFFTKIEYGLYILDRFDVLMSKIIFKKWTNIIGMHFGTKSYLKSTRNHTAKHALNTQNTLQQRQIKEINNFRPFSF